MRVLLVTPKWAAEDAYGGERSLRLLAETLAERGHDVRVAAGEVPGPDPPPEAVRRTPMTVRGIWGALREADPDVLHVYNMGALVPAAIAGALARVPRVATANSYWATCLFADMTYGDDELCPGCSMAGIRRDYRTRSPGMIGRKVPTPVGRAEVARRTWALNRYHRVVTLSEASATQMQRGGLRNHGVEVVPNMVHPEDLETAPPDRLADEPRIVYAGQLKRVKGIHHLLEALPRVRQEVPDAHLEVAGDGPEDPRLRNQAEELGLDQAVRFRGRVAGDTLREMYRSARCLAFPVVWHEPFGRVLLEAWAHGLPVVATTRGGPGDVVADGETGLLAPPRDPEALADRLVRVLRDDDLARALREAGRREVASYAPGEVVGRYEAIYEDVARG